MQDPRVDLQLSAECPRGCGSLPSEAVVVAAAAVGSVVAVVVAWDLVLQCECCAVTVVALDAVAAVVRAVAVVDGDTFESAVVIGVGGFEESAVCILLAWVRGVAAVVVAVEAVVDVAVGVVDKA